MLMIEIVVLFVCGIGVASVPASYNAIAFSNGMLAPKAPPGYNFSDTTTPLIDPSLWTRVQSNCPNRNHECDITLNQVDSAVGTLFTTIDRDLMTIYNALFTSTPTADAYINVLPDNVLTMQNLNSTIFGNTTAGSESAGLLRDLVSIGDAVEELKVQANGQLASMRKAVVSEHAIVKQIGANETAISQKVKSTLAQGLQWLIGNRTLAQNYLTYQVRKEINSTAYDMVDQADENVDDLQNELDSLQDRFNDWSSATGDYLPQADASSQELKGDLKDLTGQIQQTLSDFKQQQLQIGLGDLQDDQSQFSQSMVDLQSSINDATSGASSALANAVASSRDGFSGNMTNYQNNLVNQLSQLAQNVLVSDADLVPQAEAQFQQSLNSSLSALFSLIATGVQPMLSSIASELSATQGLENQTAIAHSAVARDAYSVWAPASDFANKLGNGIYGASKGIQTDFNNQMNATRSALKTDISGKIADATAKINSILSQFQSSQSNAASVQTSAGAATQQQVSTSQTAADLTNAQQQYAGDQAKGTLDSMVSVVKAALDDSQSTLSDIQKQNLAQLLQTTNALSASQIQQIEAAYAQIQAASADSASRAATVQGDSFDAQNTAQDLQLTMYQQGTQLNGTLYMQSHDANGALSDASDLNQYSTEGASTLDSEMSGFEDSTPNLVNGVLSQISANGANVVQQGSSSVTSTGAYVGNQALNSLDELKAGLTNYTSGANGVTTDMAHAGSVTYSDQQTLLADVAAMNQSLVQQARAGVSVVSNSSQAAMAQTLAQIQSSTTDANSALQSLLSFHQIYVNQQSSLVMNDGGNAISSALSAADYLISAAKNFNDLSQQYLTQSNVLKQSAGANVTDILNTLTITNACDAYINRLTAVQGLISELPQDVLQFSTSTGNDIAAKLANYTAQINAAQGSSGVDVTAIQASVADLQTYVGGLISSFQQQRDSINALSQKYAISRIAAITGLNATIVAQKAQFLQSLASKDLDSSGQAAQTTSTLNGLLMAVQQAQANGNSNMADIQNMISNIGTGVNALTTSLSSQMQNTHANNQNAANMNGIDSGNVIGGMVNNASQSASLIGNSVANALDMISQSQTAMAMAGANGDKDAYTIAGMLKNVDQKVRAKAADLLQQVQNGNITMDQAISAAQSLSGGTINTVSDLLTEVTGYVANHEATVDQFSNTVDSWQPAINATVNKIIAEHEHAEQDMIGDMTGLANQFDMMRMSIAGDGIKYGGMIQDEQNQRSSQIDDIENFLNAVLFGTSSVSPAQAVAVAAAPVVVAQPVAQPALVQTGRVARHSFRQLAVAQPDSNQKTDAPIPISPMTMYSNGIVPGDMVPDVITSTKAELESAQTSADQQSSNESQMVGWELQAGNQLIQSILSATKTALGF